MHQPASQPQRPKETKLRAILPPHLTGHPPFPKSPLESHANFTSLYLAQQQTSQLPSLNSPHTDVSLLTGIPPPSPPCLPKPLQLPLESSLSLTKSIQCPFRPEALCNAVVCIPHCLYLYNLSYPNTPRKGMCHSTSLGNLPFLLPHFLISPLVCTHFEDFVTCCTASSTTIITFLATYDPFNNLLPQFFNILTSNYRPPSLLATSTQGHHLNLSPPVTAMPLGSVSRISHSNPPLIIPLSHQHHHSNKFLMQPFTPS